VAPRILIFTADLGEGHDLPARVLAEGILARDPDAAVEIVDVLEAAGPFVENAVKAAAQRSVGPWWRIYEVQYALNVAWGPAAAVQGRIGAALSTPGVARAVQIFDPDVIVTTYPGANPILTWARDRGRIPQVPVVSAISDLSALRYWAHPGVDVHLVIHEESREEVHRMAGPDTEVVHVRGLTRAVFDEPCDPVAARELLDLPPDGGVVAVSGGGWGVGDLDGAVATAVEAGASAVVVLCGRNEAVANRLRARFVAEPTVRVLGFTDQMNEILAAADVLVHSTAGLTALEAQIRGTHVISYGWGVAHLRANNRAYERFGLAQVAHDRAGLDTALRRDLAAPRQPWQPEYAALPSAADVVLGLVRDRDAVPAPA
jgi:UDP-N-acetylglucosamine:LPS N-acetylglucosamine transferase